MSVTKSNKLSPVIINTLCVLNSLCYQLLITDPPTDAPRPKYCYNSTLKAQWWNIPPYIYRDKHGDIKGIFKTVLDEIVKHCCNGHTNITYEKLPLNNADVVKDHIGKNGTVISFPVYGEMKDLTFQSFPYMPVVEAPAVVFIMTNEESADAAQAVMDAVFQGWPVLVLTLVMALVSGIFMWALVSAIISNMQV